MTDNPPDALDPTAVDVLAQVIHDEVFSWAWPADPEYAQGIWRDRAESMLASLTAAGFRITREIPGETITVDWAEGMVCIRLSTAKEIAALTKWTMTNRRRTIARAELEQAIAAAAPDTGEEGA